MGKLNFFRLSNGELISVVFHHNIPCIMEIEITFFSRYNPDKDEKVPTKVIPYTEDNHKKVMDAIIKCGGTVEGKLRF